MKIRITFIAEIDTQELIEAGIPLTDKEKIQDFYYATGGDDAYHSYGETFEVIG